MSAPSREALAEVAQHAPGGAAEVSARFPALVKSSATASKEAVLEWLGDSRREIDAALRLHGAILLRGFPLRTDLDFDACVRALGYPNFTYAESLSNAVRRNRTERVFTANEAPAAATIRLHHEMAQTPVHPSRLLFFGEKPAERGGATSLCRSDLLYERLAREQPAFVAGCQEHGLLYTLVMPADDDPDSAVGRSWRSTFGVEHTEQAEERMRRLAYTWAWNEDGSLRATTPVLPAVRELEPGRRSFFNQLIAARSWKDSRNEPAQAVRLGNGEPLDPYAWSLVGDIAEELAVDFEWQAGDVALVDNLVVMHGRRSFEGTRSVLASLVAMDA